MSDIFGGSKQSSTSNSHNIAYPTLAAPLGSEVNNGSGASNQIANMLGLNGAAGQNQGFNNWKNSTGYQFGLNQGLGSITGNAATQGLLNSGGTLKAMDTFGQNYADTQYGNYMSQLQGLLQGGNQGAGVLAGAGQVSNSNSSGSSNNGGLGKAIGSLLTK